MGYYSEVSIQCEVKAFDMIIKSIKQHNSEHSYKFYPDGILKKGNEYVIQWNYVKWYSDFTDIRAVEEVLSELDEYKESDKIDGFRYDFLRLGEETGDIEMRSNAICYGSCFPETHIYVDEKFSKIFLEEVEL